MTDQEVFLINAMICVGLGIGGFLLRIALECWRDYHISKALHEAGLQETNPVRRYRRPQHRRQVVPREVLDRFMSGLKRRKTATMARIDGRWKNAA